MKYEIGDKVSYDGDTYRIIGVEKHEMTSWNEDGCTLDAKVFYDLHNDETGEDEWGVREEYLDDYIQEEHDEPLTLESADGKYNLVLGKNYIYGTLPDNLNKIIKMIGDMIND